MTKLQVTLKINPNIYIKDPISTKLGQRILEKGLIYLDEAGIEEFSFRKLATLLQSTESSIYRYFENKHYMFVYMLNWYWEWMSTRIDVNTMNIEDPIEKFKKILDLLIDSANTNTETPYIDEAILHRVVVREGAKAYRHKMVDDENGHGFFLSYKALCKKIGDVIVEINPSFKYPKSLASTLIETTNNNIYFIRHLPRLTDIKDNKDSIAGDLREMLMQISLPALLGNHGDFKNAKHSSLLKTMNSN